MPIKRDEAQRALDLLEDYHARLTRPQDEAMRNDVERVIEIFQSRLFNALLDIQEYYELTLLDGSKTDQQQRTPDSLRVNNAANRQVTPRQVTTPVVPFNNNQPANDRYANIPQTEEPLPPAAAKPTSPQPPPPQLTPSQPPPPPQSSSPQAAPSQPAPSLSASQPAETVYAQVSKAAPPRIAPKPASKPVKAAAAQVAAAPPPIQDDDAEVGNWEYEEITLERGQGGLGFSIAGGTDNPHIGEDPSIFITKLIDGGTAMQDGRLRLNDVIVSVNDSSAVNITHAQSVDLLKKAGKTVHLVVRRPPGYAEDPVVEVNLVKGPKGLGFSIAGGSDNQHIVGDNAVFITKIIEGGTAQQDGRLAVGDKLLAVNDTYLDNVTHEEAVAALKATKERVKLLISKPFSSVQLNGGLTQAPPPQPLTAAAPAPAPKKKKARKKSEDGHDSGAGGAGGPRKVVLKKGATGLGFNFVGGEDGEGIFVSFLLPGGQAERSGEIQRGDQLLSVNGVDLRNATHEQAAAVLKGSGEVVEIIAQYRPAEYEQFEAKIHDLREQMMNSLQPNAMNTSATGSGATKALEPPRPAYVKALFDYDPASDAGIPGNGIAFRYGDVFEITDESDVDWWPARKVLPDDNETGIIPSRARIEKKERARLRKNKSKKGKKNKDESSDDDIANVKVLSYLDVINVEMTTMRPVIVLGPLKDIVNDDLITEMPDRFGSCIPHTTRARRANEVDGRDYHFVASQEQMENDIENHMFIEAGQFGGNLYGTHLQSVKDVSDAGKHCILDVSGNAIKRLEAAELYPIVIFIKPDSVDQIKQWDTQLTEEKAKKAYEKNVKIEEEFGEQFTAIISGDTSDMIFSDVKDVIQEQSGPVIWVPASIFDEEPADQ